LIEHSFFTKGWCRFANDAVLGRWIQKALPAARSAVATPENAEWLRCGGTWFAGVNALPNDTSGAVGDRTPIGGRAVDFIRESLGLTGFAWDRAQISVVYPGYPQPMATETTAAFRYRRDRAAAHLDGLLPEGPQRRRHLREHHAFVLGIPLVEAGAEASPLVVWEGSHEIFRRLFRNRFRDIPPDAWREIDCTEFYQSTRRRIFETCPRVAIAAQPGEAYLVHRLCLHGIAPWGKRASATPDGRMIVYFRPQIGGAERWLNAP
jgi:hypothetical protein